MQKVKFNYAVTRSAVFLTPCFLFVIRGIIKPLDYENQNAVILIPVL